MLNPLEKLQILNVMMMILIPMGIFGMIGELLDNRIAKKHWFSLQLDDMYQKLDAGIEVRPSQYLK
tara:strand:+ start:311 stop:508 length:198 start_codon:yes stop_codon:yes gene_type:complete